MKVFKRIKWSYVVLSAMFLLLGIYLVVNPETSLIMICRILGAAMAVFGVIGGIYQALVWFADTAEAECAKRRETIRK